MAFLQLKDDIDIESFEEMEEAWNELIDDDSNSFEKFAITGIDDNDKEVNEFDEDSKTEVCLFVCLFVCLICY